MPVNDTLEEQIKLYNRLYRGGLLLLAILSLLLIVIAVHKVYVISDNVIRLSEDTHNVVTSQIPGLQSQITQRDKTIRDQQDELNQAVAAITKLAKQVKDLGGDPGQITIQPPK